MPKAEYIVRQMIRPSRSRRWRDPVPATTGAHDLARQLFGRSPQHTLAVIRAAWPAAVGAELARRTEVLALEGRVLRVRVPDAGWRKVLHRMRREILSRLHQAVGSLAPSALGFHEGPIAERPELGRRPPVVLPVGEASFAVRTAAAVIEDPELREQFVASAALYLQRGACAKR